MGLTPNTGITLMALPIWEISPAIRSQSPSTSSIRQGRITQKSFRWKYPAAPPYSLRTSSRCSAICPRKPSAISRP